MSKGSEAPPAGATLVAEDTKGVAGPPALPPVRGENAIASVVPFGLGEDKPHHILEMVEVVRENSDNLPYAWSILRHGVCDGCSLGPRGLRDDVIDGIHLCTTRLKLLRLNTMPELFEVDLEDMERLRAKVQPPAATDGADSLPLCLPAR